MSKWDKLLARILSGAADRNINFDEMCGLLRRLGFDERINGSHHIFTRASLAGPINLQAAGKQAKPYQVKQVREQLEQAETQETDDAQI